MTPGLGRSPGEGNGNPLQYSCLENPKVRGTWQATVHGVARVGHDLATEPPTTISSVQFSSVTQSCLTLCEPLNCSMPGFPVHHQLPELAQTRAHQFSDAIQPSHLSSPSPPALNLSQHQGLYQ